jgi:hypothetical protein
MNWQNMTHRVGSLLPIEQRTKNRNVCGELGEGSAPPPPVEGVDEAWGYYRVGHPIVGHGVEVNGETTIYPLEKQNG